MIELERCNNEIQQVEQLLRNGHPDIDGLLLALHDWRTERRLLMAANESGVEVLNGATRDDGED
jgi:hypothetical protein